MITTNQIFDVFENNSNKIINKIALDVLTDDELYDVSSLLFFDFNNPVNQLYYLKYYLYDKEAKGILFNVLNKYDYNRNDEIIDFIKDLNVLSNGKRNEAVKFKYINSPYIDDIRFSKDSIEIISSELGDYLIVPAHYYFKNNPNIIRYIENEKLQSMCHKHVEFLTAINSSFYSITSLCNRRFYNYKYYHSYCYEKNTNKIIDLCHNLVMDKEFYDILFNTEEVFKVEGKDLKKAYFIAWSHDFSLNKKFESIASTLFQQYIWENNFSSPNKKIYSEKPDDYKLLTKNRYKS